MKKIIVLTILAAVVIGVSYGVYLFYKPHQGIANETPEFKLDAIELVSDYDKDEKKANEKYLGKVVQVKGLVAEKTKNSKGNYNVTLQGADLAGIGCEFDPSNKEYAESIREGQQVIIKGVCTGVLMDVVLVDCVRVDQN